MSSPSPRLPFAAAALALSLALAGCFQPLYGPQVAGGALAGDLAAIHVMPISGREGHYLENELRFGFNGSGTPQAARYTLYIGLQEYLQSPLVDTVTGYPSSGTLAAVAEYTLVPVGGGDPVAKGLVRAQSSYDRFSQRYANMRASRDAEIRNARLLGQQIRANIAAAFAGKG
ncbi:hypothetical protein [Methylocella sp.]|uniref:hypothetical protein n=1 Tax=Methylocella sp. TaxID=1978226 RepID=UPI00378379E6